MNCTKCNKEIPNESKYCPFCGSIVLHSNRKKLVPARLINSMKEIGSILGIMALVVGGIVVIAMALNSSFSSANGETTVAGSVDKKSNSKVSANSEIQDNNKMVIATSQPEDNQFQSDCSPDGYIKHGVIGGICPASSVVVKQGKWLYFIAGDKLYKQDTIYGDTYIIDDSCNACEINSLNICGDYLYYRSYEKGFDSIMRIRTDGQEREMVVDDVFLDSVYDGAFLCDYDNQSIFYIGSEYRNSSKKSPSYEKYSIELGTVVGICVPDDYGDFEIYDIEIVGVADDAILAIERYRGGNSTYKVFLAKLNSKTLNVTRTEIRSDADYSSYGISGDRFFYTSEKGIGYSSINMVDLNTMQVTDELAVTDRVFIEGCYSDSLIVSNMWFFDINRFPELYGANPNDDYIFHGSVIGNCLYYNIYDDNRVFKVGIQNKEFKVIFDPETTKVKELK